MPSPPFYDGDFSEPTQNGGIVPQIPFPADPKEYIYTANYWQLRSAYLPIDKDLPGPDGGFSTGFDTNFHDEGGGIVSFTREFALLPDSRNEWESFVYTYNFDFTLIGRVGVADLPVTVQSRIQFDYFHTDDPASIDLPRAPILWTPGVSFSLNNWLAVARSPTGTEFLGQDATFKQWKGNIYERRMRFIKWINESELLFSV